MKINYGDLRNKRFYKVKNAKAHFLCPLCRSPRDMFYHKNLNEKQYIQILVITGSLIYFLFPFMGLKALSMIFIVWPAFELVNKMLYRKEIPCPYCGFDAMWYKRDVKVARKKVEEFWQGNVPNKEQIANLPTSEKTASNIPSVNPEIFSKENPESFLKDNLTS